MPTPTPLFAARRKNNPVHYVRRDPAAPPEINDYNTWYTRSPAGRAEFSTRGGAMEHAERVVGREWFHYVEVVRVK